MGDKYFVQCLYPDEKTVGLEVLTDTEIVEKVGFRDCSDCEYTVYAAREFGHVVKLTYVPAASAPFNYHKFVDPETGETVIEGYSTEH